MFNIGMMVKLSPYILIAGIAGYIYYQDVKIENQNRHLQEQQKAINIQQEEIKEQKIYFEKKIKKENFKIKYKERKKTIEIGVKKDEKDTNKSTSNRFYID